MYVVVFSIIFNRTIVVATQGNWQVFRPSCNYVGDRTSEKQHPLGESIDTPTMKRFLFSKDRSILVGSLRWHGRLAVNSAPCILNYQIAGC